ncbi:hypothetical protein LCGC14_2527630, partial [marine sediment metagenome]
MGRMKALLEKSNEICGLCHGSFCDGCKQYIVMKDTMGK